MTISSFAQAVNAYKNTVKTAESLMGKSPASAPEEARVATAGQPSFGDLMSSSLQSSKQSAYKAEAISTQGLLGKADLSDVITAVSNAELTLNTVVSVRDRMINAYQDIIKMPI